MSRELTRLCSARILVENGDAEISLDGLLGLQHQITEVCEIEIQRRDRSRSPSTLRVWLGDPIVEAVWIQQRWVPVSKAKEIARFFPEAQVVMRRDPALQDR
jgi:hypothetical protein